MVELRGGIDAVVAPLTDGALAQGSEVALDDSGQAQRFLAAPCGDGPAGSHGENQEASGRR